MLSNFGVFLDAYVRFENTKPRKYYDEQQSKSDWAAFGRAGEVKTEGTLPRQV